MSENSLCGLSCVNAQENDEINKHQKTENNINYESMPYDFQNDCRSNGLYRK